METQSEVKILVVDDREDNLLSIETILDKDNYRIVKANSGTNALKILLNQSDFTLILMDVRMPGMSGIETAELIYQREKLRNIPIIFITAFDKDEEGMVQGYRMGAVDFIYKPINPQLLRYKVGVFVELFQQRNKLMAQERELRTINASLEKEVEERKASERRVRELNNQLVQNNQQLNAINEELDRFAYVASHDLQEPLRKILLYTEHVHHTLFGRLAPEVDSSLERIRYSAIRMRELIRSILQFSRTTHAPDNFQVVDLNTVVKELLSEMEEEVQSHGARIRVGELPRVWGVSMQFSQLFQNLISNSIKFRRKDVSPEVEIFCETVDAEDVLDLKENRPVQFFHRIYVRDNGIGFDMGHAESIFTAFKRLHSSKEYEGTGIGLSICRKIVSRHQGLIRAESQVNQGTTFIITLPELTGEPVQEASAS
ncbi:sensor histidine kinase [Larkinella soli]|uniref:sensor histidine kinase n=1 Tax=Larkinella soli TaxID=1770527 RepID=UPI000FFB9BB1|nr:response regulator [Larkinella soli]